MQDYYVYFLGLLFVAVFVISQALLLPSAGKKPNIPLLLSD